MLSSACDLHRNTTQFKAATFMAIINVIILNARYFWLYIRWATHLLRSKSPSTFCVCICTVVTHHLACFLCADSLRCVFFFCSSCSRTWRCAALLYCMSCMFHWRLRKAFKSLMFTLSHTRSYCTRSHFCIYAGIWRLYNVFGVCVVFDGLAASSLRSLSWYAIAWRTRRALKTSDKKPEHVCIWCWGIREWHSLAIYACIQCTYTINWSSILWTCNFAFIAARWCTYISILLL